MFLFIGPFNIVNPPLTAH